jgi:hypothetical protein
MASATLIAPPERSAAPDSGSRGEYRCECGHVLRVFGRGRHRVFFEPDSARFDDPVMNRACPECGRRLPGKGRPHAGSEAALGGVERS